LIPEAVRHGWRRLDPLSGIQGSSELGRWPHQFLKQYSDLSTLENALPREDKRALRELLLRARDSAQLRMKIARRSYVHPNGFVKMRLYESVYDRSQLRLHIWPEGSGTTDPGDIHDHRWSFRSWVLAGRLHEAVFQAGTGNILAKLRYVPIGRSMENQLTEVGAVRVEQIQELAYEPDAAAHEGGVDRMHQFGNVGPRFSATLVLVGPPARAYSYVYREEPRPPLPSASRIPTLTAYDVQDLLSVVIAFASL
jgi:hypothetical protein